MRISMYTFLFEIDDKFYVYNTLSNALLEIEKEVYMILYIRKNNHMVIKKEDMDDEELFHALTESHILTEDDKDEFLLYKSFVYAGRTVDSLNLTIAPTMDCNYSCSYCFEECKQDIYMNEETMEAIVKFINQYEKIKNIYVTWFGGEPLMGIQQIGKLFDKMKKIQDKKYSFSMISNGFLISQDVINLFNKMGVSYIQITLDGLKETHNKVKYTKTCDDTFTRTIENIDLLISVAPNIRITLRVNVSKENSGEFSDLYKFITERYKNNPQIGIYPAFVTASSPGHSFDSLLFTRKEQSDFIQELFYKKNITTHLCRYPNSSFDECAIRNKNTFTIDPEGYLYKCWEIIGDRKYAIGKLNTDGMIESVNETILNRYLYGADPLEDTICSKCPYLPICFGGCPHKRIENVFAGKRHDTCTHLKGNLKEFIKIHLLNKANSSVGI